MKAVLLIEWKISSFKLNVEVFQNTSTKEEHLLYFSHLYEQYHYATIANETHKKHPKYQYDKLVRHWQKTSGLYIMTRTMTI